MLDDNDNDVDYDVEAEGDEGDKAISYSSGPEEDNDGYGQNYIIDSRKEKLYAEFRYLQDQYHGGTCSGMSVLEWSYERALLAPEIYMDSDCEDAFVFILQEIERKEFFAHVREINKPENYDKDMPPPEENIFKYFIKCCDDRKTNKEVLQPYMDKYSAFLWKHKNAVRPEFFPTTVPGFLDFWICVIPGYCRDILGIDEQKFLDRVDDEAWLQDIGMQIPPPAILNEAEQAFQTLTCEWLMDKNKKSFWTAMAEYGVNKDNCYGITHISNFTHLDEAKRGTLLPRNAMDAKCTAHVRMEMKHIPQEYLDMLRVEVQKKYLYLWVENAHPNRRQPADMTIKFEKPVKCLIM